MSIAKVASRKNGVQPLTESEIKSVAGSCGLPLGGYWTTEAWDSGPLSETSASFNGNVDVDEVWDPCEGQEPLIV